MANMNRSDTAKPLDVPDPMEPPRNLFDYPTPGILLEDPPNEFPVVLEKASDSICMTIDSSDGLTLQVRGVEPGPVTEWNKRHGNAIHRDIRKCDRIFEVNGIRGDAKDLMQAMKTSPRLELMVRRPSEYRMAMKRKSIDEPLGLKLLEDGDAIFVKGFESGCLFEDWNKANWQQPVRKGDRLVEVNGLRGYPKHLLAAMSQSAELILVFWH
mmetsp:Transcript_86058/g.216643  ORF Transcript_86058/g.216643 Transcript_86058/m.216643 type:complete len:212 (-) Transcript_86058:192-827(-)